MPTASPPIPEKCVDTWIPMEHISEKRRKAPSGSSLSALCNVCHTEDGHCMASCNVLGPNTPWLSAAAIMRRVAEL
eukprot:2605721-Amphidinium_carterae.1